MSESFDSIWIRFSHWLSERLEFALPSPTFGAKKLADQVRAREEDLAKKESRPERPVHSLTLGEPHEALPDYVRDQMVEAIMDTEKLSKICKYTDVGGLPQLKKAIVEKFADENGLQYSQDQVTVSSGGKQSLFNAVAAYLGENEKILLPHPCWVSYSEMARLLNKKKSAAEGIDTNSEYKLEAKALEDKLLPKQGTLTEEEYAAKLAEADKITMTVINSPSNPTGAVYTMKELKDIADVILRVNENRLQRKAKPLVVISDDIYEHMVYPTGKPEEDKNYILHGPDGESKGITPNIINANPEMQKWTVVINGVAKAFSMTGFRIGYAAGPLPLIKGMEKVQGIVSSNAATISQVAAEIALARRNKEPREKHFKKMLATYQSRIDDFWEGLQGAKHIHFDKPKGAFYGFLDFANAYGMVAESPDGKKTVIRSGDDIANYLIGQRVVGVFGEAFFPDAERDKDGWLPPRDSTGKPHLYVRYSLASSNETIKQAAAQIKAAMDKLLPGPDIYRPANDRPVGKS